MIFIKFSVQCKKPLKSRFGLVLVPFWSPKTVRNRVKNDTEHNSALKIHLEAPKSLEKTPLRKTKNANNSPSRPLGEPK